MRARGGRAVDKIGSGLLARRCAEVGAIDYRANGLRREEMIYWSKPDARETVNQATLFTLIVKRRRKAPTQRILRDRARLQKLQDVMRPSGLAPHAAELKTTEWLTTDDRAADLAVEIKIADLVLALGTRETCRAARVHTAGQGVRGIVGH
jgi:hypothetical protein